MAGKVILLLTSKAGNMCFKKKGLLPPKNLVDITKDEITSILQKAFPDAILLLSDSIYSTTSIDELIRFLSDDKTNEYRYVSEYYDCDDFSYRLMGQIHNVEWGALPFGIVWLSRPNGNHAMNLFIDSNHEVWFVEPQTDSYSHPSAGWKPYIVII